MLFRVTFIRSPTSWQRDLRDSRRLYQPLPAFILPPGGNKAATGKGKGAKQVCKKRHFPANRHPASMSSLSPGCEGGQQRTGDVRSVDISLSPSWPLSCCAGSQWSYKLRRACWGKNKQFSFSSFSMCVIGVWQSSGCAVFARWAMQSSESVRSWEGGCACCVVMTWPVAWDAADAPGRLSWSLPGWRCTAPTALA